MFKRCPNNLHICFVRFKRMSFVLIFNLAFDVYQYLFDTCLYIFVYMGCENIAGFLFSNGSLNDFIFKGSSTKENTRKKEGK